MASGFHFQLSGHYNPGRMLLMIPGDETANRLIIKSILRHFNEPRCRHLINSGDLQAKRFQVQQNNQAVISKTRQVT